MMLATGLIVCIISFFQSIPEFCKVKRIPDQGTLNHKLWVASADNDLKKMKKYINLGADKNLKNMSHLIKPIHFAVTYGNQEAITYLWTIKADFEATEYTKKTPLYYAVKHHTKIDIVKLLVSYGVKRNVKDDLGLTPYDYACRLNKEEIKKYFEETDPKNIISNVLMIHQKRGNFRDIIFE